ncbi:hypothetical protein AS026_13950 [Rhizobium altiplani]|uniref:SF3 helicase domain-containing protein n=1 Tax=Rhizobium altiplani TaxID=1864509 RepID=A0A109JDU2_9HYPH|nr:phage/plasmid primase, P4 family [Rhizobium altiplani]KWV47068.1 hypothetical protein AS026_13950 [Rhizobium altiplani]
MHQKTDKPDRTAIEAMDVVTQSDVAQAFIDRHADAIRYDWDAGRWYRWNGSLWKIDTLGATYHDAVLISRQYSRTLDPRDKRDCRKAMFASGVQKIAASSPVLACGSSHWNSDPFLLGTPDGTVDLRSGTLVPPSIGDFINRSTAVVPAEAPDCARWLTLMEEATSGDDEVASFLQRWIGYSLTGATTEQRFVFMFGPGGNGKGSILNTIAAIAHDYHRESPMETFLASGSDRHPTELAMLAGARIVTASETDKGRKWNEQRIKAMTGGDTISARFMRRDFFSFQPQFSLTVQGNHKPELRSVGDAMRRRLILVPMMAKPKTVDLALFEKLKPEWPGILRWMIDGCLEWQVKGLGVPASIEAATSQYFSEQDVFTTWLDECCRVDRGNSYLFNTATTLFASWNQFCKRSGLDAGTLKSFADDLDREGFPSERRNAGRMRIGIDIKRNDYEEAKA